MGEATEVPVDRIQFAATLQIRQHFGDLVCLIFRCRLDAERVGTYNLLGELVMRLSEGARLCSTKVPT
ncbi:hypothetical protein, partial [Rhodococcus sp. CX]|uniref:hypothetical protein n=1 Tax=Rhodococcus sp. CX TaxID=2789880 RepID=UPI001E2FC3F8